jgi:hypothetical protein
MMRKILSYLKSIEGIWSLFLLVREHIGKLLILLFISNSPFIFVWRYLQLTAENVGWWIYLFVTLLMFFAICGLFILLLALMGKISLGSHHQWYERRQIANNALLLSQEIAELNAEYENEKSQTWQASIREMRLESPLPGQDQSRARLTDRISSKFSSKYQSKLFQIVEESQIFIPMTKSEIWNLQNGLISSDRLPEIISFLNKLAVRLSDGRDQIPLEDWVQGSQS